MKRVLVNIVNYADKIPNLQELLPQETAVVNKWKSEGILEHFFLKQDKTGVYLIFKDVEEKEVRQLIPTLPLHKFFEKVEYSLQEKQF